MTHARAVGWMVVATLMWSIGGVVSRHLESARGFEVTFWRSLVAALTVAIWVVARQGPAGLAAVARSERIVWASGVLWAVMFTCFMLALSLTRVAHVLITQSLGPVFTALLAGWVLRRPVGARTWAAIVVAAGGVCSMYIFDIGDWSGDHALGVLVALGIPVAGAINWILVQQAGRGPDLSRAVLIGGAISAAATLPLAWPLQAGAHDLAWLTLLGVVQLGIPCILVMHVARYLSAAETSLLTLLEVIFGIAWTWWLGGETPGLATLLGGAAVLAALAYHETMRPGTPSPGGKRPGPAPP